MLNRPSGLRRKPGLPAAVALAVLVPLASPSRAAEIDFELRARHDPTAPIGGGPWSSSCVLADWM